jgi:hypothetical protein
MKATPVGSFLHEPVIRFALSFVPPGLITCQAIIAQMLAEPHPVYAGDLVLLGHIATRPQCESALRVVRYLSRVAILDPVYRRSASIVLFSVLKKSDKDRSVVNWMLTFVTRLTIFIGIAYGKRRYPRRIASAAEILACPQLEGIAWLYEHVCATVSELVAANGCPPYFSDLFVVEVAAEPDRKWWADFEAFRAAPLPLKLFPFKAVGTQLYEIEASGTTKKRKRKGKAAVKAASEQAKSDSADAAPKKKARRAKWKG